VRLFTSFGDQVLARLQRRKKRSESSSRRGGSLLSSTCYWSHIGKEEVAILTEEDETSKDELLDIDRLKVLVSNGNIFPLFCCHVYDPALPTFVSAILIRAQHSRGDFIQVCIPLAGIKWQHTTSTICSIALCAPLP
jgi:hypothetical protein